MKVSAKLNINKHPKDVDNGSLIDATNLMVSKDNAMLQTEPVLLSSDLDAQLKLLINNSEKLSYKGSNYDIKYCIECNKELVLFVNIYNDAGDYIYLFRYNEDKNKTIYSTKTDYSGGIIIGTFTYNCNNLIIAFSEYFEDDSKNIPLKCINLGKFDEPLLDIDKLQLTDIDKHPICPEIKIPTITANLQTGIAYKGWYYIFIRYKISNNTYTQWFNTNASIFIDSYNTDYTINYYMSNDVSYKESGNEYPANFYIENAISDEKDISTNSFNLNIDNINNNYIYYINTEV